MSHPGCPIERFEPRRRGDSWGVVATLHDGRKVEVGPAMGRMESAFAAGGLNAILGAGDLLPAVSALIHREGRA